MNAGEKLGKSLKHLKMGKKNLLKLKIIGSHYVPNHVNVFIYIFHFSTFLFKKIQP